MSQVAVIFEKYTPAVDMVVHKRAYFARMGESSFEIGYARGSRKAAMGRGPEVSSSGGGGWQKRKAAMGRGPEVSSSGGGGWQKFGLKGVAFH